MILDDGGDATMFALWGARVEAGEALFTATNEEEEIFSKVLKRRLAASPGFLTQTVQAIKGVSEETTTDRKSVVYGKRVSVQGDPGGSGFLKKTKKYKT